MHSDPIADLLTRIRNANRIERAVVDMPTSRLKERIVQVLKDEGFVTDFQVGELGKDDHGLPVFTSKPGCSGPNATLRVILKYGPEGERIIRHVARASRPGRRLYRKRNEIPHVLDGLGISIVSTSRGVMSDRQARAQKLGGELLCTVW